MFHSLDYNTHKLENNVDRNFLFFELLNNVSTQTRNIFIRNNNIVYSAIMIHYHVQKSSPICHRCTSSAL